MVGPSISPLPNGAGFLAGGRELGVLIRAKDWAATPLGPPEAWSQSVKVAVNLCLNSRFPIVLWIGRELRILYNDAYVPFLGETKHPAMLGEPGRAAWGEIWSTIGPMHEEVLAGKATWVEDFQMFFARRLPREEVYVTFSYSPILAEDGRTIEGVFCACMETTERVVGERRLSTLRGLGARASEQRTAEAACRDAAGVLNSNLLDIPFAGIYLVDTGGRTARRVAGTRLPDDPVAFPPALALSGEMTLDPWPLAEATRMRKAAEVSDLPDRVGAFATPLWPDLVQTARVVPLPAPSQPAPAGFLIVGVSPRRVLDADYRTFLDLMAEHIAKAIADARAFEDERGRADALADIDRAKTTFFSNVSHEFRTPLTLMLSPLEELLAKPERALSADGRVLATMAHRNSLRLLKLVNMVLDFSCFEAGRAEASYEPTDLARLTAELASNFHSACRRAGLSLDIVCAPLPEPVSVDRDMWEKIVLNLISNAFKFTFEGGISVHLEGTPGRAELRVSDTGVGIPAADLPRVFERFHRIDGQRGRSHEGSGIGLALVQRLVRLHGGTISVVSEVGRGTTFTVVVPFGTAHRPAERIGCPPSLISVTTQAGSCVKEALQWLPAEGGAEEAPPRRGDEEVEGAATSTAAGARILLVEDNADMRDYLVRLLTTRGWEVEAVADGEAALEAARRRQPDLVLAEAMMPGFDGLTLTAALRREPKFAGVPVVLLAARASEEAHVECLETRADDYLIKPFVARELLGRVNSHLGLSRLRRNAAERVRWSEARLQTAVDLVGLSPYSWDPVTNALEWDDRLRAMWGLPPGAHVDADVFFAGVHPEDRPRVEAAIAACTDPTGDGVYHIAYRVIGIGDGTERWVSTYGRTVFAEGRPVAFTGAALDITERKRAEERLRAVQAELASDLAAMSRLRELSMRLTAAISLPALLEEVLSAVMELQGADLGDVQLYDEKTGSLEIVAQCGLGQDFLDHFRTVTASDTSADGLALQKGERIIVEDVNADQLSAPHRQIAASTGYRAVQATPLLHLAGREPVGMLSTLFREPHRPTERDLRLTDLYARQAADVIASKIAEERLRATQERFRQFAEHSTDALWILDSKTMRLEYLSPAFETIWGEPREAMLREQARWAESIHPEDRAGARVALERVRRGEAATEEYRIVRSDGTVRWIRDTAFPIRDEQGRVLRVGGIAQDITKHDGSLVYVVDADEASRHCLSALLQGGGYDVKAFASARAFLEMASALVPGCVVLDIRTPAAGGMTAVRELRARGIGLPVIVTGSSGGEVGTAVQAMKAGAVDWLEIPYEPDALLAAVASAMATVRDTAETDHAVELARARIAEMTTREREVLAGLLAGETNKIIGKRLGISPRTVEVHRAHVMERLGARTLPELVLLAAAAVGLRSQRSGDWESWPVG
jgi:PAS domain S-box-containing protein